MAISITKYINITSSVGGAVVVATRELIGRLFTTNPLVPTGTIIEFDLLADVGTYFGTASEEYKRANFYFSWISKSARRPRKISFARWTDTDQAPMIFGARLTESLTSLQAVTDGSFTLTLGSVTNSISGLNFSGAASLAAVAALIEDVITSKTGVQWTGATVSYDSARGGFNFVGGDAVSAIVSVSAGTVGTNIASRIKWLPQSTNGSSGAVWSDGKLTETLTELLDASTEASNNFGSFLFIPTIDIDENVEIATWNKAQNNLFMFLTRVADLTEAQSYNTALIGMNGTGVTQTIIAGEYPEQLPMQVLAATDYTALNSTQNYMYQQATLTPTVTTTLDSNLYDALRVNYYGVTQQAGNLIAFYQRGLLMGESNSPASMNVYANEIWLKDAAAVALMQLNLTLPKIAANDAGRSKILAILQGVISQGIDNGTISLDGVINLIQRADIEQITGDPDAWQQVQTLGYWLDCEITQQVVNDVIEYYGKYTLVYKKDDVINKIEGTHRLI
jgi:hypothetical protein